MPTATAVKRYRQASELLIHLPEYAVVVCRECRFAVQPKAILSHLQRHRIFQKERRLILSNFTDLDLASPQEVQTPPIDSDPIASLELYDGFKCEAADCSYLSISSKRMAQHWSFTHGVTDSALAESRSAKLQTFFKGTEIRYFEVGYEGGDSNFQHYKQKEFEQKSRAREPRFLAREAAAEKLTVRAPASQSKIAKRQLDMQSLTYFHRFLRYAADQFNRGGNESVSFWTDEAPEIAAQQPLLMYGMLASAAFHQALQNLGIDDYAAARHHEAALEYQAAGLPIYQDALSRPTRESSVVVLASSRLIGIQNCIQMQIELHRGSYQASTQKIIEFIVFLQGACETILGTQSLLPSHSQFVLPESVVNSFRRIQEAYHNTFYFDQQMADKDTSNSAHKHHEKVRIYLESSLAEILPSPCTPTKEQQAICRAISSLRVAFDESFTSDSCPRAAAYNGLEGWVSAVGSQREFLETLANGNEMALVVFGNFCILLLSRTEEFVPDISGFSARLVEITLSLMRNETLKLSLRHAQAEFMGKF